MAAREPIGLDAIRRVALFQTLDDTQVQQLSTLLRERRYRRGETIFHQGDPGGCMYIILAGRVRVYLVSADGREATIRILGPESALGEFSVLDGAPRSASAAALDEINTFVLYREDFLDLLRSSFTVVERVIAMLTERIRYATAYSERLAFLSVPGRVAALLLQLADAEGNGTDQVRLELTQQELADFATTTREWVNRALRDFADRRLLRIERGAVVLLDRVGLQREVR